MSAPDPKEIRSAYADYRDDWQDIRDEAGLDMRAISVAGPWTPEDRSQREDAGRPCLHLDQINQYLHQYTGNLHETKRAVQVTPKGNGANDQDAKMRGAVIRSIEEKSNAPTGIYVPAAESAAQRSYGYAVIRTECPDAMTFDQDIVLKPIPNPDSVLLSPYYKQPNASDVPEAFLLEPVPKKDFKRKWPGAEITDFENHDMSELHVSDWVKDRYVIVAEYWRIEHDKKTLLLVKRGKNAQPQMVWKDQLKKNQHTEVLREREVMMPRVVQYMTNGLEILEENPWAGSRIPIIACFGPERWTTSGGQAKRELLSLVRFARDPQMLYDFVATCECELAGQIPKVPFVGYKGQFESDAEVWEELAHQPHAFVQADPVIDGVTGQVLPLPTKPNWEPNFQTYELAKDGAGRAIQSGMSISPLPTAAQRANQKSGIALEKIQNEEDIGTQAFLDNFENGFLHNIGWQMNELITPIYDTERELPISEPDGKRQTLRMVGNTSHPITQGRYEVQGLPEEHLHTGKGDFDVTINSGPSKQSEREAQADFVDQMVENLPNLPQPGTPGAKVLALAIRMRPDLGPIGTQIAEVFDPPDPSNLPPQAKAMIQQLQGQLAQLQQENVALHMERAGKVLEMQNKQQIETIRGNNKLDEKTMELVTQIIKSELAKGAQISAAQATADAQKELQTLGFDHEAALEHSAQAHDYAMSGVNAQRAQQLAAAQPQPGQSGAAPGAQPGQ